MEITLRRITDVRREIRTDLKGGTKRKCQFIGKKVINARLNLVSVLGKVEVGLIGMGWRFLKSLSYIN